jgi:hypothetical protein
MDGTTATEARSVGRTDMTVASVSSPTVSETPQERDGGSERAFAVVMIALSVLIFLAIRRSERTETD